MPTNAALALILCVVQLPAHSGTREMPRDVAAFAANAQACEHLGAEYDGELPAARKREIERNIRKYCGAASRQLKSLRVRYRNGPAKLEAIGHHANQAVTDYQE